ncbi:MAG: DUF3341 domain-containing protein [Saprospiraceae bacterium]
MKSQHKEVLFGLYNDEEELMSAIKGAREQHLDIMDVYTPFPVHGMDTALEMEESRLHVVGFLFGMLGTLTAFLGMTWIFTSDWPIIFGGKPYFSLPSFVPIIFELTVLFSAIGMTVVFYIVCGMGFGVNNPIFDDRITDDKFCLAFQTNNLKDSAIKSIKGFLKTSGAAEIHSKVI